MSQYLVQIADILSVKDGEEAIWLDHETFDDLADADKLAKYFNEETWYFGARVIEICEKRAGENSAIK